MDQHTITHQRMSEPKVIFCGSDILFMPWDFGEPPVHKKITKLPGTNELTF